MVELEKKPKGVMETHDKIVEIVRSSPPQTLKKYSETVEKR